MTTMFGSVLRPLWPLLVVLGWLLLPDSSAAEQSSPARTSMTGSAVCLDAALRKTVGNSTAAAACPPPAWRVVYRPPVASGAGVEAVASDDVWVSAGSIRHFDGSAWRDVPPPAAREGVGIGFGRMSAGSPDSIWGAGGARFQSDPTVSDAVVSHWDGSRWQAIECGYACGTESRVDAPNVSQANFWDVVAFGPHEAYAVGGIGSSSGFAPLFVRCTTTDCGGSHSVDTRRQTGWVGAGAKPTVDYYYYHAVGGTSASDLWVGGWQGNFAERQTLLVHWDGSRLTVFPSPDIGPIVGLAATATDDVWAVNETGILHWDGATWSRVSSPDGATAVAARARNDAWAVGDVVQHWDGTSWSLVPVPATRLRDVTIVSADDVWAVGEDAKGAVVLHYSSPAEFTDVPAGSTFYPYVHCLACGGIVGGYDDGTFRPNSSITRGQLAKFVANAAGYAETYTTSSFADVAVDSPFFQYIERLARRGIVGGYDDGTFRPNSNVTRGQAAKFVSNAMSYSETYASPTFGDVQPANPFFQFVERLAARGIIGGYADGSFRPNNDVTRGQTAKFVANAFFPDCQK